MKLLLDTCALLWMGLDASKLSERAQDALAQNGAELFVSAISAFEIGLKFARGKLELPSDPLPWFADALEAYGIVEHAPDSNLQPGRRGVRARCRGLLPTARRAQSVSRTVGARS